MAGDDTVAALRAAVAAGRVLWQHHALERLLQRGISRVEVLHAVEFGEVIESGPERQPLPTCLFLRIDKQPLHVVAAAHIPSGTCHIITVYRPDVDHFEPDFRTRRIRP